jgi:hypothetical protein
MLFTLITRGNLGCSSTENIWSICAPNCVRNCPNNFWSIDNQRKAIEDIGQRLDVKLMDDWYLVTCKMIFMEGGRGVLNLYSICSLRCDFVAEYFCP